MPTPPSDSWIERVRAVADTRNEWRCIDLAREMGFTDRISASRVGIALTHLGWRHGYRKQSPVRVKPGHRRHTAKAKLTEAQLRAFIDDVGKLSIPQAAHKHRVSRWVAYELTKLTRDQLEVRLRTYG